MTILTLGFQKLDHLQNTSRILDWVRSQTLTPELWNGRPTGRLEKWYGLQVQLLDYGHDWRIFEAMEPIEFDLILGELRDYYYPEANSVLIYKYAPGIGISDHKDKPVFSRKVVVVNLIDTQPDLLGEKPYCKFRFDGRNHLLGDGDVVAFDALTPHGLPPVKCDRYSIQFRVLEM